MISGGSVNGDSNRARKAGMRQLESMMVRGMSRQASGPIISFGPEDFHDAGDGDDDALVIRAVIANHDVGRAFVDNGSSVNILFQEALDQMDLGNQKVAFPDSFIRVQRRGGQIGWHGAPFLISWRK